MKNKIPTLLLSLSLTTLLSFDVGQEIELDGFLNARTSANFTKYAKNIVVALPKGTTGEVVQVTTLKSGNSGIKMKITKGPKAGETYWVYYNKKSPGLKLTEKGRSAELAPEEIILANSGPGPTISENSQVASVAEDEALVSHSGKNDAQMSEAIPQVQIDEADSDKTTEENQESSAPQSDDSIHFSNRSRSLKLSSPTPKTYKAQLTETLNGRPAEESNDQTALMVTDPAAMVNEVMNQSQKRDCKIEGTTEDQNTSSEKITTQSIVTKPGMIPINSTSNDQRNCPNPDQITAMKLYITSSVLRTASLNCYQQMMGDSSLQAYIEQNSDLFKKTQADGSPTSDKNYAEGLSILINNKVKKEGFYSIGEDYYKSVFGPKDHTFDNISMTFALLGFKQIAQPGYLQSYCPQFVKDMSKIINAPDKESFAKAASGTAYANDPQLWNRAFQEFSSHGGIGKCSIPDTSN